MARGHSKGFDWSRVQEADLSVACHFFKYLSHSFRNMLFVLLYLLLDLCRIKTPQKTHHKLVLKGWGLDL